MAEVKTERKSNKQNQDSSVDIANVVQIFKNVLLLDANPPRSFPFDLNLFLESFDDPKRRELIKFTVVSGLISKLGLLYPVPKDAVVTSVKSYPLNDINQAIIKITYTTSDNKEGETCIEVHQTKTIVTDDARLEDILNIYIVPCEKVPKNYPKYTLLGRE
ncbi:MAG: hypothetical protein QXV57_09185 [Thermoproteota archaeon]